MAPRKAITRPRHRSTTSASKATPAPIPTHSTKVTKRTSKHTALLNQLSTSSKPTPRTSKSKSFDPDSVEAKPLPDTSRGKIPKIPSQFAKSTVRRLKRKSRAQLAGKNMEDLASALEDVMGDSQAQGGEEGQEAAIQAGSSDPRSRRIAEMKKSLKTQPGAQRKKEKISAMERERFKGNVGAMMGDGDKWGALRAQIQSAMGN